MTASARRDVIIGIDAGTSLIKAVAFTLAGEQLADCLFCNLQNKLSARAATRFPSWARGMRRPKGGWWRKKTQFWAVTTR